MIEYNFWVNDFNRVKNYTDQFPLLSKIFDYPVSFWYGDRQGKYCAHVNKGMSRLMQRAAHALPVLVIYNLQNRDLGHHSKGGAKTRESYIEFLYAFAKGIGKLSPIVIYEPDAIPHSSIMSKDQSEPRLELMKKGLEILTQETNALVYVDVGHSNWLSPSQAAQLLDCVSNDKVRGFSVNVSNFRSTKESMNWALQVCEQRTSDHFVIDTSRNGNGPHGNDWCNPPGRCLGTPPTTNTGNEKCDAFLWIKIPGESDGKCNGGPRAGKFWPEFANDLVRNTTWISESF